MDRLKRAMDGVRKIEFSRKTLFSLLGVVMIVIVASVIIWLANFLADRMNAALTADPNITPGVRFDIEGFEKLGLTK
jgi:hypothetical protein